MEHGSWLSRGGASGLSECSRNTVSEIVCCLIFIALIVASGKLQAAPGDPPAPEGSEASQKSETQQGADASPSNSAADDSSQENFRHRKFAADAYGKRDEMEMQVGEIVGLKMFMGLQATGRYQGLNHHNAYSSDEATFTQNSVVQDPFRDFNNFLNIQRLNPIPSGFQTAWGSFDFLVSYKDVLDVYAEIYISSRAHPSTTYGSEGWILLRGVPDAFRGVFLLDWLFRNVSVKAGLFEVDYGDQRYYRSDNARVQRNPLIGNFVVDPDTEEPGFEIMSKPGIFNWLVGAGSGTSTGNWSKGRGMSGHAKIWLDTHGFRAALSGYTNDQSKTSNVFGRGTTGNLFSNNRSGEAYSGIMNGGDGPGQILPGNGGLVGAVQGDLGWRIGGLRLNGFYGSILDADTDGRPYSPYEIATAYLVGVNYFKADNSPHERWLYGSVQVVYDWTDRFYTAMRYSGAIARELNNVRTSGRVDRGQIGFGYWMMRNLLIKMEYVYQRYSHFDEYLYKDELVLPQAPSTLSDIRFQRTVFLNQHNGVDLWRKPFFQGIIVEASFAF